MDNNGTPITILVADDDPDDRLMIKEALEEARLANGIDFVEDGVELMDYLHRRGNHADRPGSSMPGLLLLDLNMPRKDGRGGRGRHPSHLRSRRQFLHHQTGHLRRFGPDHEDGDRLLAANRQSATAID